MARLVEEASGEELLEGGTVWGRRLLVQLLRAGAVMSGATFLMAILLEPLGSGWALAAADILRKFGVSLLIVTPLVRLFAAGFVLALRGEWRYGLYAVGVFVLLAVALGGGFKG